MKYGAITTDGGVIMIPVVLRGRTVDYYEIAPSLTPLTREQWVEHLREKQWFTPELEDDFNRAYASLAD